MDLSVIIVNWKVRDLLDKCLASIYRETQDLDFEVIVVDNDSRDGSVEMVATKYPAVQLIANNRNLGFAAANNQGLELAQGEFVLLLNPDTELRGNALAGLTGFMRHEPRAAIAGPRLLNSDGTLQRSVRRFPDLWTQILLMLKLQVVCPGAFRRRLARDFDYDQEQSCDQVMGAVFMIRRATLEKIGLLDAGYWVWFEEVDYCRTAASAGLETWYTPTVQVIHHGGESFGQVFGPTKQGYFDRSARYYFRKHHGIGAWLVLWLLRPASVVLSWLAPVFVKLGLRGLKV